MTKWLLLALTPFLLGWGTVTLVGGTTPAPAGGSGTDFTDDANCQGAWIIAADSEAESLVDHCGGDDDGTQNGTYVAGALSDGDAPANSPSGAEGSDYSVSGAYMTIASDSKFEAQGFTAGCWINHETFSNQQVMGKTTNGWSMQWRTGGLRGSSSTGVWDTGVASPTPDIWQHWVITRDSGSTTGLYYLDGALDTTDTATPGVGTNATAMGLGANDGVGTAQGTGSLYECFYLDRTATADEICQICKCGFADDTTSDRTCGSCSMGSGSCS